MHYNGSGVAKWVGTSQWEILKETLWPMHSANILEYGSYHKLGHGAQ